MERRFDTVHAARLMMRRWRESDREPYAAMNAGPEVITQAEIMSQAGNADSPQDLYFAKGAMARGLRCAGPHPMAGAASSLNAAAAATALLYEEARQRRS